ncbi:MAG: LysR family transcriptional regulator [Oscillospiraceae bacterium]
MTFQQLKYISAIARYGSFNEAARHLFVSQSSISTAVKEFELELGISIFIRTCRGTELSPQGQEFMRYCDRLLSVLDEISDRYQPSEDSQRHLFSVSSQHYLIVEEAFIELVARQGEVPYRLNFHEGSFEQVVDDVTGFRSELGIIFMSKYNTRSLEKTLQDRNVAFHALIKVSPSILIRRGHPLSYKKSVTCADLSSFPYVMYETDHLAEFTGLKDTLTSRKHKQTIRVSERSTLLEIISRSDAYSIVGGLMPEKYISKFISVLIHTDDDAYINIGWINHNNDALSEIAGHFIGLIQHFIEGYRKLHNYQD